MASENCDMYTPIVSVYEDGRVDVDFSSSYWSSWVNGNEVYDEITGDGKGNLLDRIIGRGSPASQLRRLADYIELEARE